MVCTFFGHKDAPSEIKPKIRSAIISLLDAYSDVHFEVGNSGAFDRMVINELESINANYRVILYDYPKPFEPLIKNSVLPEELALCPKRFAIDRRNEYMLRNCDAIIGYITRSYGGAYKYYSKGKRAGKLCINIAEE